MCIGDRLWALKQNRARTTAIQDTANIWLRAALGLSEPATPFPWQTRLLAEFIDGAIPSALDIPTGLGKTSVIAIWTVARAVGAKVPRRPRALDVYGLSPRSVTSTAGSLTSAPSCAEIPISM